MQHLRKLSVSIVFCISLSCVPDASAVVIVNVYESGGNSFIEWGDGAGGAGSLITTGLSGGGSGATNDGTLNASQGYFTGITGNFDYFGNGTDAFSTVPSGGAIGTGGWITGFSLLPGNTHFGLSTAATQVYLPSGYLSGTPSIQGGLSRPGSLSSLGLDTSQDHVWTLNNTAADTIVMKFSAPIPEPSHALLTLVGLGAIGLRRRRN